MNFVLDQKRSSIGIEGHQHHHPPTEQSVKASVLVNWETPENCTHCGNPIDIKKVSGGLERETEFATIQIGDLFTSYLPNNLKSNVSSGQLRMCSHCMIHRNSIDECGDGNTISETNSFKNGSMSTTTYTGNIRLKVDIPVIVEPQPSTVIETTSVITSYSNNSALQNGHSESALSTSDSSGRRAATSPISPRILTCDLCRKTFTSERYASKHHEKNHSKLARYSCTNCDGKFSYRGALTLHISREHPERATFDCLICRKRFLEKSNLLAHQTVVHAEAPRHFKCDICPSGFYKKVNLNIHRRRKHPGVPPLLLSLSTENNHSQDNSIMNTHNTQPSEIEPTRITVFQGNKATHRVSGVDIVSQSIVPDTMLAKTEENLVPCGESSCTTRTEGDFKCQYCGRGFLFKNNLKCHLRTHIRDKKFTCEICEKSFIYKESLKNHMLLHSNELPYLCDICGKKFRDRSNRRKHVKNVHKFLLANGGGAPSGVAQPSVSCGTNGSSTNLPPAKKKRKPPKKKEINQDPSLSTTSSPPLAVPPVKGVIVSPKATQHHQHKAYPHQLQSIAAPMDPNIPTRYEASPEGLLRSSPSNYEQGMVDNLYLPPSMQHPNVIVYPQSTPKSKMEPMAYGSPSSSVPSMGSPEPIPPRAHSNVMSPQPQHQAYVSYDQYTDYSSATSAGSLLPPSSSISPETNHGQSSYDSPCPSPYVINMVPGNRLRSSSTDSHLDYPIYHHHQQHHHHTQSIMEGYSYWLPPPQPPSTAASEDSRAFYNNSNQLQIPVVTEGTHLVPQSAYTMTSSSSPGVTILGPPPSDSQQQPPSTGYYYSDLTQFDLSQL